MTPPKKEEGAPPAVRRARIVEQVTNAANRENVRSFFFIYPTGPDQFTYQATNLNLQAGMVWLVNTLDSFIRSQTGKPEFSKEYKKMFVDFLAEVGVAVDKLTASLKELK